MFTGLFGRTSALQRIFPRLTISRRNVVAEAAIASGNGSVVVDWLSGACFLARRASLEAVGGFDRRFFLYWEDADFCRRARDRGWETWYHPGVQVTHLAGRSSATAYWPSRVAFHHSVYLYFRKHAGPLGRLLSPVVWLGVRARLTLERLAPGRRR